MKGITGKSVQIMQVRRRASGATLSELVSTSRVAVCFWASYKTPLCTHFLLVLIHRVFWGINTEIVYIKNLVYQKGVIPNLKIFIISPAQELLLNIYFLDLPLVIKNKVCIDCCFYFSLSEYSKLNLLRLDNIKAEKRLLVFKGAFSSAARNEIFSLWGKRGP